VQARDCLAACSAAGADVAHGIDATSDGSLPYGTLFTWIIFNFPHTGSQRAHTNRNLLLGFFRCCGCAVPLRAACTARVLRVLCLSGVRLHLHTTGHRRATSSARSRSAHPAGLAALSA
jgi:hypothetical protein